MTRRNSRVLFRTRLKYLWASRRFRRGLVFGTGGLLLAALAWIAVTGLLAEQQGRAIQAKLRQVQMLVSSGQLDSAAKVAAEISPMAKRADLLTSGPAWWLAAHVPYFGDPAEVVRGTTQTAKDLAVNGLPSLLKVAATVDPSTLRTAGDTINIKALIAAGPELNTASAVLSTAVRHMAALPAGTWAGPVNSASVNFRTQLQAIANYVDAGARAVEVLPPMLGSSTPKRYFIGLQNEAELRGTGGLPGAFAIAVASHGKITFTHFLSDAALLPPNPNHTIDTGLNFGAGYNAAYGASLPTQTITDSNVSPNFPYAAQIWARMWERVSGEHVDGALAVDPTTLAYFLAASGPAALPSGGTVDSANVVSLTQRDAYTLFSDNDQRKDFLVAVLKAASTKLTSGSGTAQNITRAFVQTSQQQRMLVWSSDPKLQKLIAQTDYAGAIPQTAAPFVGLVLNNASSGKLDYYLVRTLTYVRTGCGSMRDVRVTITLTNNAPASGLPPYVYARLDKNPPPNAQPGDSRTLLDYYATKGAQLESVSLNGVPSTANLQNDLGHPIFRMDLELPRSTTQTIELHLREPAGTGAPIIWRQPGVTPLSVASANQACG
ncbi:MAG: DUF4012 domain-containing protein [Jatrophihabitantaceae bacterium]